MRCRDGLVIMGRFRGSRWGASAEKVAGREEPALVGRGGGAVCNSASGPPPALGHAPAPGHAPALGPPPALGHTAGGCVSPVSAHPLRRLSCALFGI